MGAAWRGLGAAKKIVLFLFFYIRSNGGTFYTH